MMQAALRTSVLLLTSAISFANADAQQISPGATLQVDVHLVQLTCSAADRKTHAVVPITSLQQLRVYQDNDLQPNVTLRPAADLPLTLGILLDTSGSEAGEWNRMRSQTLEFLRKTLRPGDRVFILTFDSKLLLFQDLTPPEATPKDILSGLGSLAVSSAVEVEHRKIGWLNNSGTRAWDALAFAESKLAPVQGRKALIVFTDGIDNLSNASRHQIVRDAQEQGIVFFGIYVHSAEDIAFNIVAPEMLADRRFASMVNQTGGRLFNAMTAASIADRLSQTAAILRSQFTLEYPPPSGTSSGFHRIHIEANDPNIKVRTRSGVWY